MKSNTDDVKKDPENEISDVNTDGTLKYDKKMCMCIGCKGITQAYKI